MRHMPPYLLPDQFEPGKKKSGDAQAAFVRNAQHELRTPLTIVYGYTELLTDGMLGPLAPEQQQAMRTMRKRLQELCALVNRLSVLMEAEAHESISVPLVLNDVAIAAARESTEVARRAGLVLDIHLDSDLATHGNPGHLRHAIDCLLENAIKFTPAGGRIEVRGYTVPDWVCLTVADTGIGMRDDQLASLLSGFYQADSSETRRYNGIGLGLTVVKAVVEAHAGQIEVASQPGCGSQFTIKLPRSPLEALIKKPSNQMRPDTQQAWRILVVDDEENVARTLQSNLKRLPNCEAFVANNGEQALQLLAQQPFHLVITDYRMPGMDGITLAARVRQLYPSVVIVMMTAYFSEDLQSQAAHVSIWKILDKPIEISTVRSVAVEALTMM